MVDFPALAGLDELERKQVLAAGEPRRYGRREVIFHEGDAGDCLHLIVSGRCAVRVTTPLGDTATLNLLGAGDAFGELALLDAGQRRSATVLALEPTHTILLRRAELFALRERHPGIETFLTDTLAGYVRRLSEMVLEALYLPVETRLTRKLAYLGRIYGDGGKTARIRLTQEDIASLAGTTRATANRVLRTLESRGLLTLSRGAVTVTDQPALEAAAR